MTEHTISLADALRTTREQQALNLDEVASKAQVRVEDLTAYESGDTIPDTASLLRICAVYGIALEDASSASDTSQAQSQALISRLMHHDTVGRGEQFKALVQRIKETQGEG